PILPLLYQPFYAGDLLGFFYFVCIKLSEPGHTVGGKAVPAFQAIFPLTQCSQSPLWLFFHANPTAYSLPQVFPASNPDTPQEYTHHSRASP
ncbi:hypothetical protein, partial [Domibacillus tundrae]|uniref:hypothetical protein n=1 Tax=Domibacillus tundrae TaxID=1587527 RepID=UPI003395EB8D